MPFKIEMQWHHYFKAISSAPYFKKLKPEHITAKKNLKQVYIIYTYYSGHISFKFLIRSLSS